MDSALNGSRKWVDKKKHDKLLIRNILKAGWLDVIKDTSCSMSVAYCLPADYLMFKLNLVLDQIEQVQNFSFIVGMFLEIKYSYFFPKNVLRNRCYVFLVLKIVPRAIGNNIGQNYNWFRSPFFIKI